MSEKYKKDFDEGFKYALQNWDPNTGRMQYPDGFSNAFAEGVISGRYIVMKDTFGEFKSINWNGGKPNVVR
jgi:hypothetical protein